MNKLIKNEPWRYVEVLGVAFERHVGGAKLQELLSHVKERWEVFHGNLSDELIGPALVPSVNELCAAYGVLVDEILSSSVTDQQGRSRLVRNGIDLANVILDRFEAADLNNARERLAKRTHAFAESAINQRDINRIFEDLKFFRWLERNDLLSELTNRYDLFDPDDLKFQFTDSVMEEFERDLHALTDLQNNARKSYGFPLTGRSFMVPHPLKNSTAADYFWAFVRTPRPVKDISDTGTQYAAQQLG